MAQVSLPYTLTAGQPENVNQLQADLDALVAGVNTIDTAQLASGAVTTAKIADAGVTADKLGSTLASQIGVSQTGTARRVSVTASSEQTTTSTSETAVTSSESSTLAVTDNGLLLIGFSCELKNSASLGQTSVLMQLDYNGTWANAVFRAGSLAYNSTTQATFSDQVVMGTTYRKVSGVGFAPSSINNSGNAKMRAAFYVNGNTGYIKNLTATMTYIAA